MSNDKQLSSEKNKPCKDESQENFILFNSIQKEVGFDKTFLAATKFADLKTKAFLKENELLKEQNKQLSEALQTYLNAGHKDARRDASVKAKLALDNYQKQTKD
jgi:hypothetical protein